MKIEIPEFIFEMSKQMNSDPKRCTAHPFWQVRCKRYLVTEGDYNESHWEICDTEDGATLYHSENNDDYEDLFDYLVEQQPEWMKQWASEHGCMDIELIDGEIEEECLDDLFDSFNSYFDSDWHDMPDTLKKLHMQEIEQVVSTHMTQSDAEWFINRKQHDYPKLYTYVESAYWSPQLRELQDWIKSLSEV